MQLGEITEPKVDQAGPPPTGEFTYIDISSVDNKTKRIVDAKRLPASGAPSRARQRLRGGDVLVSMTRPNLNAVALVPSELDGAIGSTGFHVLRARDSVLPQWLYYGVQSSQFVSAMSELVQGALYPAVRPKDIRAFDIPLPDLDEQRRIVAELEKQFSRLDEAVANLKRSATNLLAYKQASVRQAIWGDRAADPASKDLPIGWTTAALPELGEFGRGKSKHRPRDAPELYGGPYPFVQTGDVRRSRGVIREFTQTYSEFGLQQSRLWPAGTLCITIAANIAETGLLAMPACFPDSVVGLVCEDETLARYVELYFRTIRANLERFAPATAQKNINLAVLERVQVPLPPPTERERIVAEVDRRLSIVREVEAEVESNLRRAETLRHHILSRAFLAPCCEVDRLTNAGARRHVSA